MEFRDLGPGDAAELATFACNTLRAPWTLAAQFAINENLVFSLEHGNAEGVGLWERSTLLGLAAWSVHPDDSIIWRCHTVAVRNGRKRHGLGRRLKIEVLDRARRAGARRVESNVHKSNDPMLDLNLSLGANLASASLAHPT